MSFQIVLTCPECGNSNFMKDEGNLYACDKCGWLAYPGEMNREIQYDKDEIVVKINGGSIHAWKAHDPDYPAVGLSYHTEDGTMIDIACAETIMENGGTDVTVYTYDDVYSEDWQRKFVIRKADVDRALGME